MPRRHLGRKLVLHRICGTMEREAQVAEAREVRLDKSLEINRAEDTGRLVIETHGIDGVTVTVMNSIVSFVDFENDVVFLGKDNAIEVAKAVLREYKVPFCNRVEGAGLEE